MAKRKQLARTRRTAGYTQESFAEALGVDRSTVVRWEAGDHEPLPYVRPKMARLLAVSRDELSELLQPLPPEHVGLREQGQWRPSAQDQGDHGWSSADDTVNCGNRLDNTLHTIVELSEEDLKRRDLLLGVTFTAAIFAEPAPWSLTSPPVADVARNVGGRRIGMTDVDILTDSVAHLRRMDFRYGSGRIRERAVQLLHYEATTLLRGSYSDSTGRALLTAVAQTARLAASMAADVGLHALAQRYYANALDLAMHAGNQLFAGNLLSDMSRLTIQNATGNAAPARR